MSSNEQDIIASDVTGTVDYTDSQGYAYVIAETDAVEAAVVVHFDDAGEELTTYDRLEFDIINSDEHTYRGINVTRLDD